MWAYIKDHKLLRRRKSSSCIIKRDRYDENFLKCISTKFVYILPLTDPPTHNIIPMDCRLEGYSIQLIIKFVTSLAFLFIVQEFCLPTLLRHLSPSHLTSQSAVKRRDGPWFICWPDCGNRELYLKFPRRRFFTANYAR